MTSSRGRGHRGPCACILSQKVGHMDDDIVMHDADCSFVMSEDCEEDKRGLSTRGTSPLSEKSNVPTPKDVRRSDDCTTRPPAATSCLDPRGPWESRFFCPPFPQVPGSLQHLSASHPLFSSLFPDARSMRLQMSPRFPRSFGVQRYSRLMQPEDSEKPKEEDLDQRIRALQAKNKEILRRFKEVQEDKRRSEQLEEWERQTQSPERQSYKMNLRITIGPLNDSPRGVWMVGDDFPLDECADLREYLCWKKEAERTGWESGQSHDAVQWRRP